MQKKILYVDMDNVLVDLLEGIRNLKPVRGEITHQELINKDEELINLSNKKPKH